MITFDVTVPKYAMYTFASGENIIPLAEFSSFHTAWAQSGSKQKANLLVFNVCFTLKSGHLDYIGQIWHRCHANPPA